LDLFCLVDRHKFGQLDLSVSRTPLRGTHQVVRFPGPRTVDVVAEAALHCPPAAERLVSHDI